MPYTQILFEAIKRISSSLAADEVLEAIVESTARVVNAKGCSLLLLSEDKKQLVHSATYGLSDRYLKKGPLLVDKSIVRAMGGEPVQVLDATKDEKVQYRRQKVEEGIASILSVPVKIDDTLLGLIGVYTAQPREFTPEEISFVEGIASLGALALEKARLHEHVSQDLQQCNVDLAQLSDERQNLFRFLSMAAHDLKAPLSAVQTYFGVLLNGYAGELQEKQSNILERCSARVSELLELISDLLDMSKITAGNVVTEMERIDLRALLMTCLETASNLAAKKDITLESEIPGKLPGLNASGSRLQHVITELLSNAITYTEPGGSVKLRVLDELDGIRVECLDTGIGIPAGELPHVYEDFFRASNVGQTKSSGLGLAIVKRVIEAHGGQIWVESPCQESGKGSKFIFTLPKNYS
jgi:signal transduction histidine kinase